jgi:hypothetical protein
MRLWVVGKIQSRRNFKRWQLQGIFDDKDKAAAICQDELWFIGPVELNEPLPVYEQLWPGAFYPLAINPRGL